MVLFYAVAGALALASIVLLIRPLLAGRAGGAARAESDARIYRDQLDEIERDLERGTISAGQADGARAEVSRRLLAAAEKARTAAPPAPAPRRLSRLAAGAALIGAPAVAVAVYLANGAPGLPDLPLADRAAVVGSGQFALRPSQEQAEAARDPAPPIADEQKEYAELIARLATILEQRPGDVEGLTMLGNGYMQLGRHSEAWRAYGQLIEALGDGAKAEHYAAMAEAMVLAAGGYVSPEAEQAIAASLARDADLPMARYYDGLALAQVGRLDEAVAIWERLKADAPADAPWLSFVDEMLAAAQAQRNGAPGPSAAEVEAAGSMSPEERQAMIEGMVARLEDRLTSEGGEPEEWLRLVNAYVRLGRREDAARVARLGIAAFGSGTEADFLREQALLMGVIEE
jgi:cytochrome c-type biogenesis protein CcmH